MYFTNKKHEKGQVNYKKAPTRETEFLTVIGYRWTVGGSIRNSDKMVLGTHLWFISIFATNEMPFDSLNSTESNVFKNCESIQSLN